MGAKNFTLTASKVKKTGIGDQGSGARSHGPPQTIDQAKEAAYRILSYRDRSSQEMVLKLKEKGFPADVVTEVISFLKEAGMLDDARFARQWARCRREYRYFGPIRLKGELLKKGVSLADVDQVLNEFSEEWDPEMLAERALIQRFKEPAALQNLKVRQRAFAFLQRKGFSAESIFKVFKKIGVGGQP